MLEWIMQYWIGILFGAISGMLVYIYKQFKALQTGLLATLRDSLIRSHDYWVTRGYIPVYALESVTKIYEAHNTLCKSAAMTKLYDDLNDLPSNPPNNLDNTPLCERGENSCLKQYLDRDKTL